MKTEHIDLTDLHLKNLLHDRLNEGQALLLIEFNTLFPSFFISTDEYELYQLLPPSRALIIINLCQYP